ncbi:MAG: acetate/propionate family kinase [Alphaproteobacteria bacterium]|nr:acetate/propionate family kinase [Alphaproteobacteria bacterium]
MGLILTCNAGSTNTKLAAFDRQTLEIKGHTVAHGAAEEIAWIHSIGDVDNIDVVGHRVVHGGHIFIRPQRITKDVLRQLKDFIPLAPLHQPAALRLIEESQKLYPHIPHVACFDTAFHHTMPEIECRIPLPSHYHQQGVQRYGFHGLSYQHVANTLPKIAGDKAQGRIIAAHLGGGASACAMTGLKSVASTMGFSTLDGLMMSTRCGVLDPGVIFHLLKELGMTVSAVEQLLYKESGLLGVSGISADMRALRASDKPEAREAVALYCHLAARQIAGLLPAIGGLDALVFTGGIGENDDFVRNAIAQALHWIGDFSVYVIPADEERVIAESCQAGIFR